MLRPLRLLSEAVLRIKRRLQGKRVRPEEEKPPSARPPKRRKGAKRGRSR